MEYRRRPYMTDMAVLLMAGAIQVLREQGRPVRVLEFGVGGSTLWLAPRVDSLLSIDHDESWCRVTRSRLIELYAPEVAGRVDIRRTDPPLHTTCSELLPESYDLISVDGEEPRETCALESLRLLRPGGILVIDNAERGYARPGTPLGDVLVCWNYLSSVQRQPDELGIVHGSTGRWSTDAWSKP